MINVEKHDETGDAQIMYDDETIQGNQFGMRINDEVGLELLAQLCDFYEGKGYKPLMLLNAADRAQRTARPGILKRFLKFVKGA